MRRLVAKEGVAPKRDEKLYVFNQYRVSQSNCMAKKAFIRSTSILRILMLTIAPSLENIEHLGG